MRRRARRSVQPLGGMESPSHQKASSRFARCGARIAGGMRAFLRRIVRHMSNDQAKIERAAEILQAHRIGEITYSLLNAGSRFSSTPAVTFELHATRGYLADSGSGVLIRHQGHELVVATTQFRSSLEPHTDHADGLIYFDGDVVLNVIANRYFDRYGSTIRFDLLPYAIRSMKAGPWLAVLKRSYGILENDSEKRAKTALSQRDRKQANNIDLENY